MDHSAPTRSLGRHGSSSEGSFYRGAVANEQRELYAPVMQVPGLPAQVPEPKWGTVSDIVF